MVRAIVNAITRTAVIAVTVAPACVAAKAVVAMPPVTGVPEIPAAAIATPVTAAIVVLVLEAGWVGRVGLFLVGKMC